MRQEASIQMPPPFIGSDEDYEQNLLFWFQQKWSLNVTGLIKWGQCLWSKVLSPTLAEAAPKIPQVLFKDANS